MSTEGPSEITVLLGELRRGDDSAREKLVTLVYPELRRIAANYVRQERPEHTLRTTGLVNEMYVRLCAIAVADFNRDGRPDLAVTNRGGSTPPGNSVSLSFGSADGTFKKSAAVAVGSAPRAIEVTDVNGDFRPDLVVVNSMSNSLTVLMNRLPVTK